MGWGEGGGWHADSSGCDAGDGATAEPYGVLADIWEGPSPWAAGQDEGHDPSPAPQGGERPERLTWAGIARREREGKIRDCTDAAVEMLAEGLSMSSYEVAARAGTTARVASSALRRMVREGRLEPYEEDGKRRYRATETPA